MQTIIKAVLSACFSRIGKNPRSGKYAVDDSILVFFLLLSCYFGEAFNLFSGNFVFVIRVVRECEIETERPRMIHLPCIEVVRSRGNVKTRYQSQMCPFYGLQQTQTFWH